MRIGIIQSSYIPWRGYLDFVDEVDLFIFLDDVQFTPRSWRTRNRIKTPRGAQWLTVPVVNARRDTLIQHIRIDNSRRWVRQHIGSLVANYSQTPYFKRYSDEFFDLLDSGHTRISEMNVILVRWLMQQLDITTPLIQASELGASGKKTERLLQLIEKAGGDTYLSGPTAKGYIDESLFREAGIRLEYKSYEYPPYPQPWGPFLGEVTVLDLLFNTGPKARRFLKSLAPNEIAVP